MLRSLFHEQETIGVDFTAFRRETDHAGPAFPERIGPEMDPFSGGLSLHLEVFPAEGHFVPSAVQFEDPP